MEKEQLISEIGSPAFRLMGKIHTLFLLVIISTPFIAIWHSWSLAWKVGLSGIIACVLCYLIYRLIRVLIKVAINEVITNPARQ